MFVSAIQTDKISQNCLNQRKAGLKGQSVAFKSFTTGNIYLDGVVGLLAFLYVLDCLGKIGILGSKFQNQLLNEQFQRHH